MIGNKISNEIASNKYWDVMPNKKVNDGRRTMCGIVYSDKSLRSLLRVICRIYTWRASPGPVCPQSLPGVSPGL